MFGYQSLSDTFGKYSPLICRLNFPLLGSALRRADLNEMWMSPEDTELPRWDNSLPSRASMGVQVFAPDYICARICLSKHHWLERLLVLNENLLILQMTH